MTTAVVACSAPAVQLTNKDFIQDPLWHRLVSRIVSDLEFGRYFGHEDDNTQQRWAERILDQTVAFLRLCAAEPNGEHGPSPLVDIGWHTFILHTREYDEFCQSVAGYFIHHCPVGGKGENHENCVDYTVEALRSRGIVADELLWFGVAECGGKKCYSDCSQTTS